MLRLIWCMPISGCRQARRFEPGLPGCSILGVGFPVENLLGIRENRGPLSPLGRASVCNFGQCDNCCLPLRSVIEVGRCV